MAHHGSLSRERRSLVESRLRAGELRALVATASLELGIDIGPIDLVCQIASPRSLATFLQRVGRSGHRRGATPEGRLFPMTRDDLVECCALLAGLRAGRLDAIEPPVAPLDILAQQLVAECAARGKALTGSAGRPERRQTPRAGGYDAETATAGSARTTSITWSAGRRPSPRWAGRTSTRSWSCVSSGVATGRGTAGGLPASGPRPPPAPRPARRPAGRAHLRGCDPRERRLPRGRRARRGGRGQRQRGLGDRVDGRRRLPARQHLVADHPGDRRARCGWSTPRGRRPRCPSGWGRRRDAPASSPRRCPPSAPRSTRRSHGGDRRPRWPGWSPACGVTEEVAAQAVDVPGGGPGRARPAAHPRARSSWSAASTSPAAPRSWCTRPSGHGSIAGSGWRCASASAPPSTSSCRRRPATTRCCSRSGPSTAFRSRTCPGSSPPRASRRCCAGR